MNPNCCGGHCRSETGEVRVYPLGGGANLILCSACWAYENHYRRTQGRDWFRDPNAWPQHEWSKAEVYNG